MPLVIKAEALTAAVNDILKEYGDDAKEIIEETITDVAREAAKNVKTNATGFNGTGKYAKGWKSKIEKKRATVNAVVYNASLPGLAHLLEFGHAKQNGGRTAAYPHIAAVNDWAQDEALNRLKEKL